MIAMAPDKPAPPLIRDEVHHEVHPSVYGCMCDLCLGFGHGKENDDDAEDHGSGGTGQDDTVGG